jgi:RHS repeat-associated protein
MKTLSDLETRTSTSASFSTRITWSGISDHSRRTTPVHPCSINRYYDPTTDSFTSVDPDLQSTGQSYVFTNDNPLNGSDPLGLICWSWSCIVKDAGLATNSVVTSLGSAGNWVTNNSVALGGLTLDGGSAVLDFMGASSGNPSLSAAATGVGFVGTTVSAYSCKDQHDKLGCIGLAIGAITTTIGIAEVGLEAAATDPGLASFLKGVGLTLSGAAATVDAASVIVKIYDAVEAAAKKIVVKGKGKK